MFFITFARNFKIMKKMKHITSNHLDFMKERCFGSLGEFLSKLSYAITANNNRSRCQASATKYQLNTISTTRK